MKKSLLLALSLFVAAPVAAPVIAPTKAAAATNYETEVEWGVNFRSSPSTGARIYRMLRKGENIHVISKVNRYWYKVKTKSGTIGYISTDPKYTNYSSRSSNGSSGGSSGSTVSSKADQIIATAQSLKGRVTYKFGVNNTARLILDCSSFTKYVFGKHGVSMKWGTRFQKNDGHYVSKSNLKKGDLVFFDTNSNGSINHVGIYIGNGQFIHNKPRSGVVVNSLNTGFWKSHYTTARRVL
ncbi:NlpC/P60 family protein [Paenibacillus tarimensis]